VKRILAAVATLTLCVTAVWTSVPAPSTSAEPKIASDVNRQPGDITTFMRLKLSHSQNVLEGVALEDFEQIAKHAQSMALLSEDEKWMIFQTPEYRQYSAEFQQICRSLQRAAEKKNLDGAALAYVQLTMSCVNCHKYTRGVRMAAIPADAPSLARATHR